jgi:hypothetical protein
MAGLDEVGRVEPVGEQPREVEHGGGVAGLCGPLIPAAGLDQIGRVQAALGSNLAANIGSDSPNFDAVRRRLTRD